VFSSTDNFVSSADGLYALHDALMHHNNTLVELRLPTPTQWFSHETPAFVEGTERVIHVSTLAGLCDYLSSVVRKRTDGMPLMI